MQKTASTRGKTHFLAVKKQGQMDFVDFPTKAPAMSEKAPNSHAGWPIYVGFAAPHRGLRVGMFIADSSAASCNHRKPTEGSFMTAILATKPIEDTAFARLESEGRLLNPLLKAMTSKPGRFGFRGEMALRFAPKLADEARPPELLSAQAMAIANLGEKHIPFYAGYLLSFEYLKDVADTLGDTLTAGGKYFLFCNNIDLSKKYQVPYKGAMFYVLPIDESTVYNELLDLFYLEKNDLKKKDTAGKLDAVADAALKFDVTYDNITYEEGLKLMGPVRNPNENRPV
jgi:hypothetical protein